MPLICLSTLRSLSIKQTKRRPCSPRCILFYLLIKRCEVFFAIFLLLPFGLPHPITANATYPSQFSQDSSEEHLTYGKEATIRQRPVNRLEKPLCLRSNLISKLIFSSCLEDKMISILPNRRKSRTAPFIAKKLIFFLRSIFERQRHKFNHWNN